MKVGKELNALIADKVMGYRKKKVDCNSFWTDEEGHEPEHSHEYSTDIGAAWEAVAKIHPDIFNLCWHVDANCWACTMNDTTTYGESAPHAICLAALRAVS